jgi:hypothetical protein
MKTYIDVPIVAYETWLITTHLINDEGKRIDDDDNGLLDALERLYPERPNGPHVLR